MCVCWAGRTLRCPAGITILLNFSNHELDRIFKILKLLILKILKSPKASKAGFWYKNGTNFLAPNLAVSRSSIGLREPF
jgi:hypothetical protein